MKVSTKGRYALRLMANLARVGENRCTPINEIAEQQGLSEKYLEQIVRSLVRENLVISMRGAQGGYLLARKPSEITVGQVLRATEGDLAPVDCVSDGRAECLRADNCETMFVWRALKEATDRVVDGITIEDLVTKSGSICPSAPAN
jgi:Rrf2 family protein